LRFKRKILTKGHSTAKH